MAIFWEEYKFKGKKVIIRNAEPDDALEMIELVKRLDEQTVFLSREPGEFSMDEAQERAYIASRKDMPNYRFAVAEIAGRIVASSDAFFLTRQRYHHVGEVAVAVDAAHWGIGVGRALLEEGIAWLKENGVEKVNLTVDTQNFRAISLYQHLGFVVEGRQEHERRLRDGTYRDAYWMGLKLR